ncbi:hypothetical protein HRI_002480800 [Hibiscus trionum]|uniref:Tf2-1-like SH3-like domain-containing protein n=1 Tax=Hibiscus trionum TaxID=183268 RepID=A0A9W7M776_HIBTR|nr:hypothetical protein HRI_002480800 [Hibiscus trionum]
MKNQADKRRRELELQIGDWAFIRLQPYRQLSLRLAKHTKLSPRFFGPYKVTHRIGPVAYRLDLPATARIHPVFHVSQLKLCRGQPLHQFTPLPLFEDSSTLEDKVELPGGGGVADTVSAAGPEAAPTNAAQEIPLVGNEPTMRRGGRERKTPRGLTDFVLY